MDQFISFFTDYYKFIIMFVEFVVTSAFSIVLGFRLKKSQNKVISLSSQNSFNVNHLIMFKAVYHIPEWITEANALFPNTGVKTGPLKLQFVVNKFKLFIDDNFGQYHVPDRTIKEIIENILSCDKNILKEVSYEENQSKTVERPESVRQDCQSDESAQRSSYYVPRRD